MSEHDLSFIPRDQGDILRCFVLSAQQSQYMQIYLIYYHYKVANIYI